MTKERLNRQATEDYLKAIHKLSLTESPVTTSRIGEALNVRPSSVTSMLKKLNRLGLVDYTKHRGATLTEAGEAIALKTIRRHRLLELFLTESLGYEWHEVHEEAELLEHAVSQKLTGRIAEVLGQPVFDPHGEPIPAQDGQILDIETRPMTSLSVGDRATVSRISDDSNRELLTYLGQLCITPGSHFIVIDKAPFDGPITVQVNGEPIVVGYQAARHVFVEAA
jgi:DtxR family Mn-dependent transcriptional regulator